MHAGERSRVRAREVKGLLSATQQRGRRRRLSLTVHNVTTARDLVPPREDETRRRTSRIRASRVTAFRLSRGYKGLNVAQNSLVVRVDTNPPPQSLRQAAESAAHSGDLRSMHPADLAAHSKSPWDELLRVWDPGD
jgi:hypothetical protein